MQNNLMIKMSIFIGFFALLIFFATTSTESSAETQVDHNQEDIMFAIHGGSGTVSDDLQDDYREVMEEALEAGKNTIEDGGTSVEAVEDAILLLEDSPLLNAGRGSVFNTDAAHELDASIMSGEDLEAGAVAGVENIKNPISLAHEIMEESEHVMLGGDGADLFGIEQGLETVTQDYFFTERRWEQLLDAKEEDEADTENHGTVGAVALDENDNLAAGTSTGGLTNKAVGRIGDSPIIGAGTYADNDGVAVSATGTGEVFIRGTAARDISALVEFGEQSVYGAAETVVEDNMPSLGATGAVIALDHNGNLASPFSSSGLSYGYVTNDGEVMVEFATDEEDEPISAADINEAVERFDEEGEFASEEAVQALTTHLTAVSHYEELEEADNVVEHMEGFNDLLDHQQENEVISEEAFETLQSHAEDLMAVWE
ncbi:isoaspartyl peptidase/L-asparaginase [Salicibibacter halophilus]|uniref:Isoaspartyl peptidase/L-asparaginase n=1 Tax=Salicibibacter halophilus TaxID=2502791 RepID=A0A514LMB5_9BACI|nr:isoaspartyl peptidase/L-asparaginase [Salicibibacter halophilus]QDI92401.1 isoaspartyl peptidase/L-asparaginase [Salicibibacter halophilus]